jgi:hypothetical protein
VAGGAPAGPPRLGYFTIVIVRNIPS